MENNTQNVILSQQGLDKILEELNYLKTEKRKEIAKRIQVAKDLGDLSENSEYDSAKEDQGFLEGRIAQLENMVRNAVIVDEDDASTEQVTVGSTVEVLNTDTNKTATYTLVGQNETDPRHGKISTQAPVGAALLGTVKGQTVEVDVPAGKLHLKVVNISLE